jgi:hypothetical protein
VDALHERYKGYRAALAARDDAALTVAIQSRLAGAGASQGLEARRICAYIRRAKRRLDLEPSAGLLAGRIAWPQIGAVRCDAEEARGVTEEEHAR